MVLDLSFFVLQVGLNGVDNGALLFRSVRIPRQNLLDRFCSVDRSGRSVVHTTGEGQGEDQECREQRNMT
jgi:hypothetical protein